MNACPYPQFADTAAYLDYVVGRGGELARRSNWEKPFVLDESNRRVYQVLAQYFMGEAGNDPASSLNLTKGILLFGALGTGKSEAMRLFALNPRQSFRVVSSRRIVQDYRQGSDLTRYRQPTTDHPSALTFGQPCMGLCIDDLGIETHLLPDGREANLIRDILLDRYDHPVLRHGPYTHLVTSAGRDELLEMYGPALLDRMRERFNVVAFPATAQSRRQW